MNFQGSGAKLADIDLPRIGFGIGCGEDELHAFLDVETSGGGWDAHGRPKMLFEPHVFYRNLKGSALAAAVAAGLAYAAWKPGAYPADSYPRLVQAMAIDETAALKAASWGIGQVLGENFVAAGYQSVQAMVLAAVEGGEPEQLAAAVRFIKANHLDDELRAHNWAGFARGYNGAHYAANGYDTKLAAAYRRWAAIRDTPYAPALAETLRMAIDSTPAAPVVVVPVQSAAGPLTPLSRDNPPTGGSGVKPAFPPPPQRLIVVTSPAPEPAPPAGFFARLWAGLATLDTRKS